MTDLLLILPLVLPLLFSIGLFLLRAEKGLHSFTAFLASLALLITSILLFDRVMSRGLFTLQLGDWPAPYGITFVADAFSSLMCVVVSFLGLCTVLYSLVEIRSPRRTSGYYSALLTLLAACNGILLAGDIFNLYVWVEVMVISSFLLMSMGNERKQIQAALPYVVINFTASIFILAGVGLLFGLTGTLNLADLSLRIREGVDTGQLQTIAMVFLFGFGVKSALFPLFFWLPDAYPQPPVAVSAIFAGLYTKVSVCVLIRLFSLLFVSTQSFTQPLLIGISIVTMLVGVLGALAQYEFRRLLSFHIISQVGYMSLGLAFFSTAGVAAAIYFVVHNILAKANLFFISGLAYEVHGSFHLKRMGGLLSWSPWLGVLFFISAYSLGGLPPLSGFWGKYALTEAAFSQGFYLAGAVCLIVGFLTIASMTKIWIEAFLKPAPGWPHFHSVARHSGLGFLMVPITLMTAASLYIGLFPGPLMKAADLAAHTLLYPQNYIEAVLGEPPP